MHWFLFIKYYSPLHVSSLKFSSSGGYSCIHAAYGTVTLCEISWWPFGTQLEWELTVGGRLLVDVLRTTFPLQSVLTQAVYRQATRNSHREWQCHMLHVCNCILLKMSTWCSKHVEENSVLWINNNQCIKLVINILSALLSFVWFFKSGVHIVPDVTRDFRLIKTRQMKCIELIM